MSEILDLNEAASTLFPDLAQEGKTVAPSDNSPHWLDEITKLRKAEEAGVYDKTPSPTKPEEPNKGSNGNTPPASLAATKAAVESVAKEMGFSPSELPESLSQFVADNKLDPSKVKGLVEIHNQQVEAMQDKMAEEWRRASELSIGLGDINVAKQVVQKYGDSEFQELINSPIGNHPALIRFLANVGKSAISKGRY